MTSLYGLPKDMLIKLLTNIQEDTRKECAKDISFIKNAIDRMKIEQKREISSFINRETQTHIQTHICECYSDVDEWCEYCDY